MPTLDRMARIEHFIHWPPKYAEGALAQLRQEVYDRTVASSDNRIETTPVLLELAKPALPRWKADPVSAGEFIRELKWDVFCAINGI